MTNTSTNENCSTCGATPEQCTWPTTCSNAWHIIHPAAVERPTVRFMPAHGSGLTAYYRVADVITYAHAKDSEIATLHREKAALLGLQEGMALLLKQAEQSLSDWKGAAENSSKSLAAVLKAVDEDGILYLPAEIDREARTALESFHKLKGEKT